MTERQTEHLETGADPDAVKRGHELHDVEPRQVGRFYVGLAFIVIFCLVLAALSGADHDRTSFSPKNGEAPQNVLPPEPRLQASPQEDMQRMLREQKDKLATYGWVDQQRGVVRIPIMRAMDLLIEQEKRHAP